MRTLVTILTSILILGCSDRQSTDVPNDWVKVDVEATFSMMLPPDMISEPNPDRLKILKSIYKDPTAIKGYYKNDNFELYYHYGTNAPRVSLKGKERHNLIDYREKKTKINGVEAIIVTFMAKDGHHADVLFRNPIDSSKNLAIETKEITATFETATMIKEQKDALSIFRSVRFAEERVDNPNKENAAD